MQVINIGISIQKHADASELPAREQELIRHCISAMDTAYAPYSGFRVGAALLMEDGSIITGSNQENAAYPSGLCAERVAFFAAGSQHPEKKILAVAVTTDFPLDKPVSPCGACRQVMAEYELKQNSPIRIFMVGKDGTIYITQSIQELLPMYFSGEWLKK